MVAVGGAVGLPTATATALGIGAVAAGAGDALT
jgi:hypothetical protein